MIRITNLKTTLDTSLENIHALAAKSLGLAAEQIKTAVLTKKSIDARQKANVHFVLTIEATLCAGLDEAKIAAACPQATAIAPKEAKNVFAPRRAAPPSIRPIVVGSGPAGLFAALYLARLGLCPIVLERGEAVDARKRSVDAFWSGGALNENSNVQFGEGGAGTFSDGKLTTGTHDPRGQAVLDAFVEFGAPPEVAYLAKPHIGTDKLCGIVKRMRKGIEALGGEVRFSTRLAGLIIRDGALSGACIEGPQGTDELPCTALILAIGHSARDTFHMLHDAGVHLAPKPFSIGVRIEHPQSLINQSQYGAFAAHPALGAADYKLACHLAGGRSVYTFCMCPGGQVVAAASEVGGVVTNGMSLYRRDGQNANSALLVGITPDDFGDAHPLAGIAFQRRFERLAFAAGGGDYRAPAQRVGDFLRHRASSTLECDVEPTYLPGVTPAALDDCLPAFASAALREGLTTLDRRLFGFAAPGALMTGIETRSSSPVRIPRDAAGHSSIRGLFPCGEGAGYAGGILSSAVDGLRMGEALAEWCGV